MVAALTSYFSGYGYLAVFLFVLLIELGVPGLPNEIILLSLGHLCHQAGLSFAVMFLIVVIADMLGSLLLYLFFYHGKQWLLQVKPKWISIPYRRIDRLKEKIAARNGLNMLIGKLTPFVRSYVPVVAGLMQISPTLYTRIVFFTAVLWSGSWVTAGWFLQI